MTTETVDLLRAIDALAYARDLLDNCQNPDAQQLAQTIAAFIDSAVDSLLTN